MSRHPGGLHGAYRRQELERRLGTERVKALVRVGSLQMFARGVLVEANASATLLTRAAAALIFAGPDAVICGFTALSLLGCTAAPVGPPRVLVPYHRNLRPRSNVVVHHGTIDAQLVEEVAGLRIASTAFVSAQVLCREQSDDSFSCTDQMLGMLDESDRSVVKAAIREQVGLRPDPRGKIRALALLDLATGRAESPAECRCLLRLFDGALPVPELQFPVLNLAGEVIYRLDFAWPEFRVALEYDGYAAHEGRELHDTVRADDLRRRGWTVIRASSADLRDPSRLLAELRRALSLELAAA